MLVWLDEANAFELQFFMETKFVEPGQTYKFIKKLSVKRNNYLIKGSATPILRNTIGGRTLPNYNYGII